MSNRPHKPRIFKYLDFTFPEPGAEFTAEQVRQHLAGIYPEIAYASTEEKELPDGTVEITFRKQIARKGNELAKLITRLAELPILTNSLPDLLTTIGDAPTLHTLTQHFDLIDTYDDEYRQTHWRQREVIDRCNRIPPSPLRHLPLGF